MCGRGLATKGAEGAKLKPELRVFFEVFVLFVAKRIDQTKSL
jgi:hypothetical protein